MAIATLAAVATLLVVGWLLVELLVQFELYITGAASRAELGDDLGLGILLISIVPIGSLASAVIAWRVVWSATRLPGGRNT